MRILRINNANWSGSKNIGSANRSGFTLLELLVVIGLTVILGTVGILSLSNFRQEQQLSIASRSIVTVLRDTQAKAVTQEGGTEWGIRFENPTSGRDQYHLFSGPSFSGTLSSVALPGSVEFEVPLDGATLDVVFDKITGLPTPPTSVIIRLTGRPSLKKTITINAQGTIEEQ